MKNLKTFLLYFWFIFSVLFTILNIDRWVSLSYIHTFIFIIFLVLSLLFAFLILKKINEKKWFNKFTNLIISILVIVFYISPVWTMQFPQTSWIIDSCNYGNSIEISNLKIESIKNFQQDKVTIQKFTNIFFQDICNWNNILMIIPFIVNPDIIDNYWKSYIENKIIKKDDFYVNKEIIDKYILNNLFFDAVLNITRDNYTVLERIIKEKETE